MTEWTTIRVKKDARDEARKMKPDNTSWSEWITDDARAPELPIQGQLNTIEERTGKIERLVEELTR